METTAQVHFSKHKATFLPGFRSYVSIKYAARVEERSSSSEYDICPSQDRIAIASGLWRKRCPTKSCSSLLGVLVEYLIHLDMVARLCAPQISRSATTVSSGIKEMR
jgi:hypothetical protein